MGHSEVMDLILVMEPFQFYRLVTVPGMEETNCNRKEVLQELVGNISNYWVTEGPFGRIRAKNNNTVCE